MGLQWYYTEGLPCGVTEGFPMVLQTEVSIMYKCILLLHFLLKIHKFFTQHRKNIEQSFLLVVLHSLLKVMGLQSGVTIVVPGLHTRWKC